jgi:hypothetical protein
VLDLGSELAEHSARAYELDSTIEPHSLEVDVFRRRQHRLVFVSLAGLCKVISRLDWRQADSAKLLIFRLLFA